MNREAIRLDSVTKFVERDEYFEWIEPYLVFLRVPVVQRFDDDSPEIDGEPDLMLVPSELKMPSVFQRKWPITGVVETRSVSVFYTPPSTVSS
jgi:hypothetical protein